MTDPLADMLYEAIRDTNIGTSWRNVVQIQANAVRAHIAEVLDAELGRWTETPYEWEEVSGAERAVDNLRASLLGPTEEKK